MQIVKSDYDLKLEFTPLEFETVSKYSSYLYAETD